MCDSLRSSVSTNYSGPRRLLRKEFYLRVVKRPAREGDHLPLSTETVRINGVIPSLSHKSSQRGLYYIQGSNAYSNKMHIFIFNTCFHHISATCFGVLYIHNRQYKSDGFVQEIRVSP